MMVSVIMTTYGHEKYIKQAIKGVLMQECEFDYELIIANDCSPDDTDAIVKQIISTHPKASIINYTRHKKNKGMHANFEWALNQTNGRYVAICEGDDYWTDSYKLQKQVDFLEVNQDCALVHTSFSCKNEINIHSYDMKIRNGDVFQNLLIHDFFIATLTVCVRKSTLVRVSSSFFKEPIFRNLKMSDYPLWLEIALISNIYYLPDNTAFYRILPESASHSRSKKNNYLFFKSVFDVKFFFANRENVSLKIKNELFKQYCKRLIFYGKYDKIGAFNALIFLFKNRNLSLFDLARFLKGLVL